MRNCSRLRSRGSLSAFVHYATGRDLLKVLSSVRDLFSRGRRNATDMCIPQTDKCLVLRAFDEFPARLLAIFERLQPCAALHPIRPN